MERLQAEAIAIMRWPGRIKTCSLRKVEMLSTPAVVRVSANMTRPSRTRMPQQYVMTVQRSPQAVRALYTDADGQAAIFLDLLRRPVETDLNRDDIVRPAGAGPRAGRHALTS